MIFKQFKENRHHENNGGYNTYMKITSDKDALERFETIWENVECGICVVDAETRTILDINPVAVRMFGDSKDKILGKRCHKFICPAEFCSCPIMDKNQVVDRSERKFIKANGEVIPIIKSVAKIMYQGRLVLLESFTDISNLKEAEEKLRVLRIAEQANKAKGDFLSTMSHEMRTPMNAIIGMTKIAERTNDVEKLKYCLNTIGVSSQHLLGLINDILDMSKIESGKLELEQMPFNIEMVIKKVCSLVSESVQQKNIKLIVLFDKCLNQNMNFLGDEMRLSQVITNLVSNAVKFTPEFGKIKISINKLAQEDDSSILQFIISDSGIGIAEEQKKKLFLAFEQADKSISRLYGGTGLGLIISKQIVEKMNGKMWVESELNKGSTFGFSVKLKQLEEVSEQKSGITEYKQGNDTFLIISTDEEVRESFVETAFNLDIHVDAAESIEVASQKLEEAIRQQNPYDIVFVNFDSNKLESMKNIQNIECLEQKKVVILSTYMEWSQLSNNSKYFEFRNYITKPVFPSDLLRMICNLTGKNVKDDDYIESQYEECYDLSGITILLVEDIEINREIFITLLEDTNVKIDIAENGIDAIEKFGNQQDKYDVIIMDIQMPYMDGYKATRAIRALDGEKAKNIPIIAMTANAFSEDIKKCMDAGMNAHIAKPIDKDIVVRTIVRHCRQIGKKTTDT